MEEIDLLLPLSGSSFSILLLRVVLLRTSLLLLRMGSCECAAGQIYIKFERQVNLK